jgi:hypothetical protein
VQFARPLRERVRSGAITCSVRVWHNPRVRTGGRYRMEGGWVVVESVREIAEDEVDDALARRSGFADVGELMATARHGGGANVYLVEFRFEAGA